MLRPSYPAPRTSLRMSTRQILFVPATSSLVCFLKKRSRKLSSTRTTSNTSRASRCRTRRRSPQPQISTKAASQIWAPLIQAQESMHKQRRSRHKILQALEVLIRELMPLFNRLPPCTTNQPCPRLNCSKPPLRKRKSCNSYSMSASRVSLRKSTTRRWASCTSA